ncbi:MAG: amino acid adenylation domain-containing protein [Dolichospermum sp. DET73]|nr:amino acid adenylation domain-containing protein [Dolichospermum sp. DET73]
MLKQCIHELFKAQVARTPQAIAVVFRDKQLTYQELDLQTDLLANYLQKLGVGTEVLVGICLDRSLEMIVGLLGILKAGGAYLPLDPNYPAERLNYMIQDAQISVLVTQEKWSTLISDYSGTIICLDSQHDAIFDHSDSEARPRNRHLVNTVKPDHLAYVIYTSGSTGKPKGVMIEHQSLVNFTQMAIAQYNISTGDRILQFSSISFDVAAEEIYPGLSCGATLVLRTEEMISSVSSFVQQSQDWQITVWDLPTAYWHLIVNELAMNPIALPESLRLVIIGGERVLPERVKMWLKDIGHFPQLINCYGPTETTVAASICCLSSLSATQLERTEIPIGKPMGDNIEIYILDQNLESVPTETIGEIYIGGAGLAKGYLHRPELTAEKFIKNPFDRVANRRWRETEGLIGMIVNNIVLRTDLSGNPTFRELLSQVRNVTLEGYANEDLPFDKVVEILKPERNLSYNPLFQVMFSFHDALLPDLNLPGLSIKQHETLNNKSAKFDLDVVVMPRSEQRVGRNSQEEAKGIETEGITLVWEYNSDLFDVTTIERMTGEYQTLVAEIVANPDQQISQYPLLTKEQQHQLLINWNETKTAYPQGKCIHQLVEEQVDKNPDAVALVFDHQKLTYGELNTQANQLAHYLKNLGVKPDTLVGICIERSFEMIVGLLAILKAGGAYVSLDPAYPAERLSDIVNDAQLPILVTMQQWATIAADHNLSIVCLDTEKTVIATQSQENPDQAVAATNLAYVIYTSGSTGKPKGVLIEHNSLVNFTQTAIAAYQIIPTDRVLQFASISFDTAAEEIYPCLSIGATLVLRTEEMLHSMSAFVQQSQNWGLTVWDLPTAYWHLLVNELANGNLSLPETLRLVIIGGERALPEKVATWHKWVGNYPKLVNSYGPTETTVIATLSPLSDNVLNHQEIPIGKPISNVQVYVLDKYLQPVPIGVPGELHIGGAGVARGYLHLPELTAEKFIKNPFVNKEESRLYKTGDLVRYQPDGNLEYLGRIDSQVKIRGFRIELGEIETILNQHSQVNQAVVIAREDIPGNKRLVAYIIGNQAQVQLEQIRQFLKQKLPPYMIPAAFVPLDQLPMTPNGKVDHRALPIPDTADTNLAAGFVAPQTPIEEKLVAIWAEVLRQPNISIHDNFFELGGDSIISIQMISRANQAGLQLTPKQLFQYQTIAELANVVGTNRQIKANQGLVTGSIPLMPIQHWFFEQNFPDAHYFNQSALLEIPSITQPDLLKQAVQKLLSHHDILRSCFVLESHPPQHINATTQETVPFMLVDLSALSLEEQQTVIKTKESELQASLNLSSGEIVRFALFNRGINRPNQLLIIIHHLVVDGISWRILLEDLATAYQQLSSGETIKLPAKTTSFQEWANQLQAYSQSENLSTEIDYWLSQFAGNITSLPIDYPDQKTENTLAATNSLTLCLNEEETRALLQDVPSAYNTQINDILLTALAQSFHEWTGANSLIVDLEGHGREDLFEDIDLSRTVGWFTTLFPVQLNLGLENQLAEILKLVKEQLRRLPKHGIGYGILRYLHPSSIIQNKFQTLPQAEISFNYLGQFDQVMSASAMLGAVKEWKSEQSQRGYCSHLLAISGLIHSGKLEMEFAYSEKIHKGASIEKFGLGFMEVLRTLILHCKSKESSTYTPSDFAAAKINQQQLDKFLEKINRKNPKS